MGVAAFAHATNRGIMERRRPPLPVLTLVKEPEPAVEWFSAAHEELDRREPRPLRPSMKTIAMRIAKALGIKWIELRSPTRKREIAFARQAVAYWCLRQGFTTVQVGRFLKRDHTTVLHGAAIYPEKRTVDGRYLPPVTQARSKRIEGLSGRVWSGIL